jgi:hypothetical protein
MPSSSGPGGIIHDFFWMAGVLGGRALIAEMGEELRSHLG